MRVQEFTKPLVTRLLTESAVVEAEGKNTHLEHLEDNIFNKGYDGAKEAINYLYSLHEMLDGSTNSPVSMTTKWDGAPAIVAQVIWAPGHFDSRHHPPSLEHLGSSHVGSNPNPSSRFWFDPKLFSLKPSTRPGLDR